MPLLSSIERAAHRLALRAEAAKDQLTGRWHARYGYRTPLTVVPYRGWGAPDGPWHLRGRVVADSGVRASDPERGPLRNLVDMIRRYRTREVPRAVVRGTCAGRSTTARADKEGYFELSLDAVGDGYWQDVTLELLEPRLPELLDTTWTGQIQAPTPDARFGVVSDVDDTIVRTGAATLWRHLWVVLFNSAHSRTPFPGVDRFYRALHAGPDGAPRNPIWYLTSSPWNLYDLFVDFMRIHDIPAGTLVMKDFGLGEEQWFKTSHLVHKRGAIMRLFDAFPALPFVLIGDSGQQDAEIYGQIALEHPDRVLAIYIRHVAGDGRRQAVERIAADLADVGVDLLLCEDTEAAARHAVAIGLIDDERARDVIRHSDADWNETGVLDNVADAAGGVVDEVKAVLEP